MLKLSPDVQRWATVCLVIVVGLSVGRQASVGMDLQQWLGAAAAVLGSIALAALIYNDPQSETVED